MIYLDHLATTPCAPEVIEHMTRCLRESFGNPSSSHALGWAARELVEEGRASLASLLGIRSQRITLTSGATEASYLGLTAAIEMIRERSYTEVSILTQVTEHPATLGPLKALCKKYGIQLRLIPISTSGQIDLDVLKSQLDHSVKLVSIMHVNNELGVIQPITNLCDLVRRQAHPDCLIHVDGAQAVGKIEVNLHQLDVDLYSLSAHKFYGPKGIGALCTWLRGRNHARHLAQVFFGGGQERGLRPGTVATHQVVGLGVAANLVQERCLKDQSHVQQLENILLPNLVKRGAQLTVNAPRVTGALSLLCTEEFYEILSERWSGKVIYSQSSACHSGRAEPSHVLRALGLSAEEASRTVRIALGRYTQPSEIAQALSLLD